MNDLILIACGAGLHDGLNPCIFMTCAVFVVYRRWLVSNSAWVVWFCFIFAFVYLISTLIFDFGPGQLLTYQKNFIFIAKILYLVLGGIFFVVGILFFQDWLLLCRHLPANNLVEEKIKLFAAKGFKAFLVTIFLAVILSALASLYPISNYIIILGSAAILRSQWQIAVPLLSTYIVVSMWALWFVWAFVSIKSLRPSLLKIICAAVFFTASSCMILIFK